MTIVHHVRIDGKWYILEELPEEKQEEIKRELNRRAVATLGYEPEETA